MSVNRHKAPTAEQIFGSGKNPIELGMLQMQILWLLDRAPSHGYEIMETLNRIKSTKITQGTLYPTLKNLHAHGYVVKEEQADKIVYHITPSGKKILNESCLEFTRTFFGIFRDFVCNKCVGEAK